MAEPLDMSEWYLEAGNENAPGIESMFHAKWETLGNCVWHSISDNSGMTCKAGNSPYMHSIPWHHWSMIHQQAQHRADWEKNRSAWMQEISENAWDDEQASGYNHRLHSIGPLTHDPVTSLALGWSMVKLEQNWSQVQKINEYAPVTQKGPTHSNIWLRYCTPPYMIKQRGRLRADHVKNRPFDVKFWSIRPMYNPVTSWASELGQSMQKNRR